MRAHLSPAAVLAAVLLAVGCSVEIPEGRLRCATDAECPPGYACRTNLCFSPSDAGAIDGGSGLAEAPTAIACGARHSCALTDLGRVYCWGNDMRGQVGDDSFPDAMPVVGAALVSGFPEGTTLEALDLGDDFSCALDRGVAVWCWGSNDAGQLGNPSVSGMAAVPTRVMLGDAVPTELAVGGSHACVLDDTEHLLCWGQNQLRQLGDGTTTNQPMPIAVLPTTTFTAITAGAGHTCALSAAGVSCWGSNALMQLGTEADPPGTGISSASSTPIDVAFPGGPPTSLVAMGFHTCGARGASFACWGWNVSSQLAVGMPNRIAAPTPVMLGGAIGVMGGGGDLALGFGGGHTCAVVDRIARCWGRNAEGQLGRGATSFPSAEPTNVLTLSEVTAIDGGWYHTCAVANGVGYCWGESSDARLGLESASDIASPIAVSGLPHR